MMTRRHSTIGRALFVLLFLLLAGIPAPSAARAADGARDQEQRLEPYGRTDVSQLSPSPLAPGLAAPRPVAVPRRVPDPDLLRQQKERAGRGPLASAPVASPAALPSTLALGASFAGSNATIWDPPDPQVAAGPGHVVEVVNGEVRIMTRTGTTLSTVELNRFFGLPAYGAGTLEAVVDPMALFDPESGRWFIAGASANDASGQGFFRLAVSVSSDPTGLFVLYAFATSGSFPDFDKLGVSSDKVVTSGNAWVCCGAPGGYQGTEFVVWNKASLVAGTSVATRYFPPDQGKFAIRPARSMSPTPTLFLAATDYWSATDLRVWSVTGVPGVGAGVAVTSVDRAVRPLSAPPEGIQAGSDNPVDTGFIAFLDAVYRDGSLWLATNAACVPDGDTAPRACLHFLEVLTAGLTVNQDFDFGTAGAYSYFPAIQTDSSGNLSTVFSRSSATEFPSVYASGRLAGEPLNTMQQPVLVKAGETYCPGDRWGDYSGASIDPADPTKVWLAGEYQRGASGGSWGTWIAQFRFAGELKVVEPLSLSSTSPYPGDTVTARFKIKNIGGVPLTVQQLTAAARMGSSWTGTAVDFPYIYNQVLQPGQEYLYQQSRSFTAVGDYLAEPQAKVNYVWGAIPSGNRVSFAVVSPLVASVTVVPTDAIVGGSVRATMVVRNVGPRAFSIPELTAAVRLASDPAGTAYDFGHVWSVTLQAGQQYLYDKSQAFNTPGAYFVEPRAKLNNVWQPIGERASLTISPKPPGTLQVSAALTLSPSTPYAQQSVTARFAVKNTGGQALTVGGLVAAVKDSQGGSFDFPLDGSFVLQPGQEQVYQKVRTFPAGSYVAEPRASMGNQWQPIAGGNQVSFEVRPVAPGRLQVTRSLWLSPPTPRVGEYVTAGFIIKNVGDQVVSIQELTAAARLGSDWNGTQVDFPHAWSINLQPGQSYTYQRQRTFSATGDYFAEPRVRINNAWGAIDGGNRVDFSIKVFATVPVGQKPTGMAVNPNTNRVYVTNAGSNSVSVIDGAVNRVIATIPVGAGPTGVAVNPNANRVYVANTAGGTVSVIDAALNRTIATFSAGYQPRGLGVSPATGHIFVGNDGGPSSNLRVYDGTTHEQLWIDRVAPAPTSIAVDPLLGRVYVAHTAPDNPAAIVVRDGPNAADIAYAGSLPLPADVAEVLGIGVDPAANRIYLTLRGPLQTTVARFGGSAHTLEAAQEVGSAVAGIGVNPGLGRVYVVHGGADAPFKGVALFDGALAGSLGSLPFGKQPLGIGVNPATNRVYVADFGSAGVTVIQDY